ncbi:MAG: amino acid ABC transporter substrate-binding protein [Deltaproteobacteria bacterium]|nr:MAG: amino acid ABC transporter substrate-binding protein [Deltaproteobacteria bacterium]
MLKNIFIIFCIFSLLILFSGCNKTISKKDKVSGLSKIQTSKEIKIAIDANDFPPFALKTPGGYAGFDIEICYDIAKKMGVKLIIEPKNFDEILPAIDKGKIDLGIATFTITPERNMKVLFSQPYFVTGQAILINKKYKDIIFSFNDLNSTDYKVAFVKGNSSENSLKKLMPDSRFFPVNTTDELVDAVVTGKADAVIADLPFCSTIMAKDGGENLYFIDKPITFEPIGIAVNKNNFHLLNWINTYIRQIQSDGTYDEFYEKWFQKNDWIKYLKK